MSRRNLHNGSISMKSIIDESKMYSVKEVAELLGFCKLTILRSIRSGRLRAVCPGGKRYRITGMDLANFLRLKVNEEVC